MDQSTLVARREIAQNEIAQSITALGSVLGLLPSVEVAVYRHDPHRREIAHMEQLEQIAAALKEISRHVSGLCERLQEAEVQKPISKPAAPATVSPTANASSGAQQKQQAPVKK